MKPCRIVKSAYKQAGSTLSLKAWAKQTAADPYISQRLKHACQIWLDGKRDGQAPGGLFKPANGPGPTESDIAEYKRQKAIAANPQFRATLDKPTSADKAAAARDRRESRTDTKPVKRGQKGGAK